MRMVMKMAAVSTISLLLLCCSAISSTDSKEVCDYLATGANFTVPMMSTVVESDRLRWKHDNKYIVDRKAGEFLEGNKMLISENGSLKLTNVMKKNSGSYVPEVFDKDGAKKLIKFEVKVLCVIDPVLKPVVKPACKKPANVQFTCDVQAKQDPQQDHNFEWLMNGVLEKEKSQILTRQADQVKTDSFSCRVSNKVNSMTSAAVVQPCIEINPVLKPVVKPACKKNAIVQFTCDVQAKQTKDHNFEWLMNGVLEEEKSQILTRQADQVKTDSFSCRVSNKVNSMTSAAVVQPCIEITSFFPETLLGINTWIFVGAGGGVVLLLIIVVIVCCVRSKRSKRLQLKEEEELQLAWTNDQHQHHQHNHPQEQHPHQQSHHHHHPHKQPAGHTGPRQQRSKQQHPRNPDQPGARPLPSLPVR
ncbi:T-cell surface antigen CD2-like isoform X1 [Cebidichthys violaceus]|uniref:T-cell surface antigen CD2-like isoform X1 n=2 Tax=Cebidichthys violaceus TaxID=271503 RepID=UPI0035CC5498